jgi:hypothetical protein
MGWLRRLLGDTTTAAPDRQQPTRTPAPSHHSDDDGDGRWYVPQDGNPTRFVGDDGLPTLRLITYTDTTGETVLRFCETSTGLLVGPSDTRLAKAGLLVSQLRGESYHQPACRTGNFSRGATVRLVPEPENPYDDRAVAVYDATGRHKCGYVNKQKARAYLKRLAAGEQLEAISLRGTSAGRPCAQVTIVAATPAALARVGEPMPAGAPRPVRGR